MLRITPNRGHVAKSQRLRRPAPATRKFTLYRNTSTALTIISSRAGALTIAARANCQFTNGIKATAVAFTPSRNALATRDFLNSVPAEGSPRPANPEIACASAIRAAARTVLPSSRHVPPSRRMLQIPIAEIPLQSHEAFLSLRYGSSSLSCPRSACLSARHPAQPSSTIT
jgi:hypothetical protein